MKASVPILLVTLLAGCATDWSRNVYEGVRQSQQSLPDSAAAQPAAQPDYERYKRERNPPKTTPTP